MKFADYHTLCLFSCARCVLCSDELPSLKDAILVDDGYSVCERCFKSSLRTEYCPVCRKKLTSTTETIKCECKTLVHKSCDPELTHEHFEEFSKPEKFYFCPICRKEQKSNQIVEFINLLSE